MTINKLHKLLGNLIEQGRGTTPIAIDKRSFVHPLEEDGAVIMDIKALHESWINTIDDDGGIKINKDGSESGRCMAVLIGDDNSYYLKEKE